MDLFGNVGLNSSLADDKPSGTFDWGNFAGSLISGAASVGLATLAKSQGVSTAYSGNLYGLPVQPIAPRPITSSLGSAGVGLAVIAIGATALGLILWAALRKG